MATRKTTSTRTTRHAASPATIGNVWLAGVGAVSLARKRGQARLGEWIDEGTRLSNDAGKLVRDARSGLRSQFRGVLTPARARIRRQFRAAGSALQSGAAGVLSRLGIPTKRDIDELGQRVTALSRQLKSHK